MRNRGFAARLAVGALCATAACAPFRRPPPSGFADDASALLEHVATLPAAAAAAPASGSLWTDAGPGAAFARDTRAWRTNDLLTVRVEESSLGTNSANTDLARSSAAQFGATAALGLESSASRPGRFDLANALKTSTDTKHAGEGRTSRSSSLDASITTRVLKVLPNGDLVVGGQKTVMVNRDRQLLTLVGSVRTVDVAADNTVRSSAVGDLTVRLWGRGEVDETTREGWFIRVMHRLWPF